MNEEILDILAEALNKNKDKVAKLDAKYSTLVNTVGTNKESIKAEIAKLNTEFRLLVQESVLSLPKPENGKDGRDGRDFNESIARTISKELVDKLGIEHKSYLTTIEKDIRAMIPKEVDNATVKSDTIATMISDYVNSNIGSFKGKDGKDGSNGKDAPKIDKSELKRYIDKQIKAITPEKEKSITAVDIQKDNLVVSHSDGTTVTKPLPKYSNTTPGAPIGNAVSEMLYGIKTLIDVEITNLQPGDTLVFNTKGKWVNKAGTSDDFPIVTTDTTLSVSNLVTFIDASTDLEITLPPHNDNKIINVKRIDTTNSKVTLIGTIDGVVNPDIGSYENFKIVSKNSNWYIL